MTRPATVLVLMMLAVWTVPLAEVREPRYPLKTDRTLFSDAAIAQVRENVANYDSARKLAEPSLRGPTRGSSARTTSCCCSLPSADVPRAFNVGTEGCPKCGKAIYEKGGTYPWTINLERLSRLQCPYVRRISRQRFRGVLQKRIQRQEPSRGEFADDGRGWTGPPTATGTGSSPTPSIGPGTATLSRPEQSRAGVPAHGRQAVCPSGRRDAPPPGRGLSQTDYHNQSRYGFLTQASGGHYGGKLVNLIWRPATSRHGRNLRRRVGRYRR